MLWKVIVTFIVVMQLAICLPVKQDKCQVKRQLCGDAYKNFIDRALCTDFDDCPKADDVSMPKIEHIFEIIPYCCKKGCSVSYLKFTYCNPLSNTTTHPLILNNNNRQKPDAPMWMYFLSAGNKFSNNWLRNYFTWSQGSQTEKPIYQ